MRGRCSRLRVCDLCGGCRQCRGPVLQMMQAQPQLRLEAVAFTKGGQDGRVVGFQH